MIDKNWVSTRLVRIAIMKNHKLLFATIIAEFTGFLFHYIWPFEKMLFSTYLIIESFK